MEDLWKKFKEETREHMQKINDFLHEKSLEEKNRLTEQEKIRNEMSNTIQQTQQIVLNEDELINSQFPEKKSYGKLKNMVKEIMEKENLSRAQAYRLAKKRILENFK